VENVESNSIFKCTGAGLPKRFYFSYLSENIFVPVAKNQAIYLPSIANNHIQTAAL
jgi:hypothetical protein